ncbi:MAG: Ig-like domain-containing protein [Deltaproteobacteria bacterium]|nr:Ig-like domain-containing protein [Deltaproteobacteria bacterium]
MFSVFILILWAAGPVVGAGCGKVGGDAPWSKMDYNHPVIVRTCPVNEQHDVTLDVRPRIILSFPGEDEPDLDPNSVKASMFSLVAAPDHAISLDVYMNYSGSTIIVEPRERLLPFVRYYLKQKTGIEDEHGNAVTNLASISFVTCDAGGDSCTPGGPDTNIGP